MRASAVVIGSLMIGAALAGALPRTAHKQAVAAIPSEPSPADWRTPRASGGTLDIPRGEWGHFFVTGDVAGQPIHLMVDTGATAVALSRTDARAVGINVDHLSFDISVETASGTAQAAHVLLPRLRVGDIQLLDVSATVMDRDDGLTLLGQSFLSRIDDVSIRGDTMRLTKS
jgi:aspartyl protease family protein